MVVGLLILIVLLLAVIAVILNKRPIECSVILPEKAEEAVQKIVEAYRTLERVKLEAIDSKDLGAVYQEAKLLVIANLRERIAIVEDLLSKLEGQRSRYQVDGLSAPAINTGDRISYQEEERDRLLSKLEEFTNGHS